MRYRDCLPRPVSRMLMQPGQRVENAAFADVRVSGQRNGRGARVRSGSSDRLHNDLRRILFPQCKYRSANRHMPQATYAAHDTDS